MGPKLTHGVHRYVLGFLEEYAGQGYNRNGWGSAFLLAGQCYEQALPGIFH